MILAEEPEVTPLEPSRLEGYCTVRLAGPALVPRIGERRWYGGREYRIRGYLDVGSGDGVVQTVLLVTPMTTP